MRSHGFSQPIAMFSSEDDQRIILEQLHAILGSVHFRNSKRCLTLLDYSVRRTLEGDAESLRERPLGVTLFGREPSYDTNADPVVRMAAGEVRKRLAQYYQNEGRNSEVKIELPPGSYVADLHIEGKVSPEPQLTAEAKHVLNPHPDDLPLPKTEEEAASVRTANLAVPSTSQSLSSVASRFTKQRTHFLLAISCCVLVIIAVVAGLYIERGHDEERVFWSEFLAQEDAVPVVIGQLKEKQPQSDDSLQTDIFRNSRLVSIGDVSASMTVCNVFAKFSRHCSLLASRAVDLSEIRKHSALFIGGFNNPWSLRLTDPLRFGFEDGSPRLIVDRRTGKAVGGVDFKQSVDSIQMDYSILARFHSDVTDSLVVVIAGVGPMSTEAAAEFLSSPDSMQDLRSAAPVDSKAVNMEAVLATDIVNGRPGHTRVVASYFW